MNTERNNAVGCIHVHSDFSDGSGSVEEIMEAANAAELDFLILTDHRTIKAKRLGLEGWYDNTLLLVGEEVGQHKGHFLSIGAKRHIKVSSTDPVDYVNEIHKAEGLCFVTHPDGKPKPQFGISDSRWKKRGAIGIDGMEIWSYMYDWIDRAQWWNLPHKLLRPQKALLGPKPETLKMWDHISWRQPCCGYGGADAHAKKMLPGLEVFPYEEMFRTIRNHLLLKEPFSGILAFDKELVMEALRTGRCYFANDSLADSSGFRFSAQTPHCEYSMGDRVPGRESVTFRANCPVGARQVLTRNSVPLFQSSAEHWSLQTEFSGVFRLQVYLDGRLWVLSNPITVFE